MIFNRWKNLHSTPPFVNPILLLVSKDAIKELETILKFEEDNGNSARVGPKKMRIQRELGQKK